MGPTKATIRLNTVQFKRKWEFVYRTLNNKVSNRLTDYSLTSLIIRTNNTDFSHYVIELEQELKIGKCCRWHQSSVVIGSVVTVTEYLHLSVTVVVISSAIHVITIVQKHMLPTSMSVNNHNTGMRPATSRNWAVGWLIYKRYT